VAPKEPVPPVLLQLTPPVGVTGVPAPVSLTLAVHVVAEFTGTVDGEQLTVVAVDRWMAVMVSLPEEPVWSVSPE
jgi:hypothetical protein